MHLQKTTIWLHSDLRLMRSILILSSSAVRLWKKQQPRAAAMSRSNPTTETETMIVTDELAGLMHCRMRVPASYLQYELKLMTPVL